MSILEWVASNAGSTVVKIDRWVPSGKACHVCGTVNTALALKQRSWTCDCCHAILDRDTKEEDEYLITHYHTDGAKKCANMLGKTEAAVFARAVILGLTKPMVRWTHEQEEYLIEHYQTNAVQKCADILGKTKNAVQGKAGTLGLTRIKVDWTREQDEYLTEHYLTDGVKKCAEALGRTYNSIQNRVRKLGLAKQRRRIIID